MSELKASTQEQLERLRGALRALDSVLVCYSGGTDSALVLAVATSELGARAVGLTAVSPSLAPEEKVDAARIAQTLKADHRFVESNELARPGYAANGPDRCFHCKTELYTIAREKAAEWGLASIVNGTNLDDLGDYRPGLDAAREAGVKSPLIDAGLDKAAVRAVAQLIGLPVWDKPAAACLSSRIPYGSSVTPERLGQIGGFEAELHALGFRQVRVRWHETVARIEVALEELPRLLEPGVREAALAAGKRHGFSYITLDLAGYRQGSHNEVLSGRSLRILPS
ncbi:MAG TPA: ATP-dependent sacrificial sulfur transferase LarE [Polyangiaceae bacterium]|nr:ATP-dependent sacrificial sulfur transferase LarE [Polyangiaceae bacterium]